MIVTADNRGYPRHELGSPAVILLPGFYLDATALDVSQSGALLEISDVRLVPRNATCVLRLLSDNERQLVEFEAKVVRFSGNRKIGVRACNVSAGALGALRHLLEPSVRSSAGSKREVAALLRQVDPAHLSTSCNGPSGTRPRQSA